MDPVSAIGAVGSVIGVLDIATRSINKLNVLRSRYRQANFLVSALLAQLYTVQATLHQIKQLQHTTGFRRALESQQLQSALEVSLEGCDVLMASLEEQLDQLSTRDGGELNSKGKLTFLWQDQDIEEYSDLLGRQISALNLLLQAIQCNSLTAQYALLQEEDSITVMRLARECTESLHVLEDSDSRVGSESLFSRNSTKLSMEFDFDSQILGSRVYQAASKFHLRALIRHNLPHSNVRHVRNEDGLTGPSTDSRLLSYPLVGDIAHQESVPNISQETAVEQRATLPQPGSTEELEDLAEELAAFLQSPSCDDVVCGNYRLNNSSAEPNESAFISELQSSERWADDQEQAIEHLGNSERSKITIQENLMKSTPSFSDETSTHDENNNIQCSRQGTSTTFKTRFLPMSSSDQKSDISTFNGTGSEAKSYHLNRAITGFPTEFFRDGLFSPNRLISMIHGSKVPQQEKSLTRNMNSEIKMQSQEHRKPMSTEIKIHVLGDRDVAVPALINSMKLSSEAGDSIVMRDSFKKSIFDGIIRGMQALMERVQTSKISEQDDIDHDAQLLFQQEPTLEDDVLPKDVGLAVERLWADNRVRSCYYDRPRSFNDNLAYFCQSIQRIAHQSYHPNDEDILRSPIKSVGLTEHTVSQEKVSRFSKKMLTWRILEYGTLNEEKKKWTDNSKLQLFVFFAIDVACFAETDEHDRTPLMRRYLSLFNSTINGKRFEGNSFVLLLLITPKLPAILKHTSLKSYFPEYEGDNSVPSYIEFLGKRFAALNRANQYFRIIDADFQYEPERLARLASGVRLDIWRHRLLIESGYL